MGGAIEEGGKVAMGTVEALKSQPLALALIVINVLFLLGSVYVILDIAERADVRNIRIDKMLDACINKVKQE